MNLKTLKKFGGVGVLVTLSALMLNFGAVNAQLVPSDPDGPDAATGNLTADGILEIDVIGPQVIFQYPVTVQISPDILEPNMTYTFSVPITNVTGNGDSIVVTDETPPPTIPGVASVVATNSGLLVEDGATGELVYDLATGDFTDLPPGNQPISISLSLRAERL